MTRVIDTNVLHVANDTDNESYAPACVLTCTRLLVDVQRNGVLALDDGFAILREYRNNAREVGQPGVGDSFLKWTLSNAFNDAACARIPITPHPSRGYAEFPTDPALAAFDRSDRKFVAVSCAHLDRPAISHATDRGWSRFRDALQQNSVVVDSLCPEHLPDSTYRPPIQHGSRLLQPQR